MLAKHEREAPSSRRYAPLARSLLLIPVVFRSPQFFANRLCFMHATHADDRRRMLFFSFARPSRTRNARFSSAVGTRQRGGKKKR